MRIAITGGTGFIGGYIIRRLQAAGHECRAWYRSTTRRDAAEAHCAGVEWIPGRLGDKQDALQLIRGCDALVHAALDRPGMGFRGAEGDLEQFVTANVVGSIQLFEAAQASGRPRVIFISTCAVHEQILEDRPLDENHPIWPKSHYGAHKGAIEQFVHSYGLGMGLPFCSLRPCGVYGRDEPVERSKWFKLVKAVAAGQDATCERGGKEVHVEDVAQGVEVLLNAPAAEIAGQSFNGCDRYVSEWEVAHIVKGLTNSPSVIHGQATAPLHQIETAKLRRLGMQFGGDILLRKTIQELVSD